MVKGDYIAMRIKYFNEVTRLERISKGNWIDVRCASKEDIVLKAGEFKLIPLGFALELPKEYEGRLLPRSSTFKNFGIIQTNSMGIVDDTYTGDNDQWYFPAYALRDTVIKFNDRIAQMTVVKKADEFELEEVEYFGNADRGGIGSTGTK